METLYLHTEAIHNTKSASIIVPILLEMLDRPQSVLDVGCGTGTWLKVFSESGIGNYIGIDGFYVNEANLVIASSNFVKKDLRTDWALNSKFDLILCLEVAEHLPEPVADRFIANLVSHGDTIIFSAAIPGQGGQNHLNEQWPDYWQKKFQAHGFYFHDTIRPLIWHNANVDWWYKQNIFLVNKQPSRADADLSLVHPTLFRQNIELSKEYVESLIKGQQGLSVSARIFMKALAFKIKNILK